MLFEKNIIYSANNDKLYIDFYKRMNNMENIEELEILKMLEETKEDVKFIKLYDLIRDDEVFIY